MSENLWIGLLSFAGGIIGALMTSSATWGAALIQQKNRGKETKNSQRSTSCVLLATSAMVGGISGLILGALLGVLILKNITGIGSAPQVASSGRSFDSWSSNNKPRANEKCPIVLIEGLQGQILDSLGWIENEKRWTVAEPISHDVSLICSRRSDKQVYIFVGTTTSASDLLTLDKGSHTAIEEALRLIQTNSGKPIIVIPW